MTLRALCGMLRWVLAQDPLSTLLSDGRPVLADAPVKPSVSLPRSDEEAPRRWSATELFAAHAPFVAKFLWRMRAPESEIGDLVQDVFLIVHARGGFVSGEAQPTTWLASIAFRVWSSERRRFRRSAELLNDGALARAPAKGPTPVEALATAERLRRIRSVLNQIDERSCAILILVDLEGSSCIDVAQGLAIPVGTVYSRLHQARKRFARLYEKPSKSTADHNGG